ncbi:hypothetical protein OKW30_007294 [Paraburkholderia sp. Clong3]|nr:hypothetical protein [Paraburkholderia sp. UCT31]
MLDLTSLLRQNPTGCAPERRVEAALKVNAELALGNGPDKAM